MRIIGGYLKGQKILIPSDKSTRPLKDRVRQSIFNIIEHSKNENLDLNGSKILDLFAGTGSFGIECLSRGAESVIFFENYLDSNKILKQNLEKLELTNKTQVFDGDSYEFKKNQLSSLTESSQEEQKSAGLDQCSEEEYEEIKSLNKSYKEKFQFPFIIAVKGLNRLDIIKSMKKRVDNNYEEEFLTAINEVHKIAKIRLDALEL